MHKSARARVVLFAVLFSMGAGLSYAKGIYSTKEQMLKTVFPNDKYEQKTLWINGDLKQRLQKTFGRQSVGLRTRYWQDGQLTFWILNEIGKELPITIGVVLEDDLIRDIVVMEYRESRGGEVRRKAFTRQFEGAELKANSKLSVDIDGISGATLSVRAMKRVAQAALIMKASIVD